MSPLLPRVEARIQETSLGVYAAVGLFLFGSVADTVTTYMGLTRGLAEDTQTVVYLIDHMGLVPGLLTAKVLAALTIGVLAGLAPLSTRRVAVALATVYGAYYTLVSIHNLSLIWRGVPLF